VYEILGHVVPGKIAGAIKDVIEEIPVIGDDIAKAADNILKRTNVIDIGEKRKDDNRWY